MASDQVQIVEVGPRDGLQSEPDTVPTAAKVALIDSLMNAGLRRIEATSFVSAAAVPQLADAEAVLASIERRAGVEISALVPNARGLSRAIAARVDRVAVFTSASETFAGRNIGCSIDESFERFAPVADGAWRAGLPIRGYISMAWHCPYEGAIALERTVAVVRRLDELGCDEIAVADTIGLASPADVRGLLSRLADVIPIERIAVHFHDTGGRGIANVEAAVATGVRVFDGAIGGLGGCPFAPGSPGNLSTEALVETLTRLGFDCGVDVAGLGRIGDRLRSTRPWAA